MWSLLHLVDINGISFAYYSADTGGDVVDPIHASEG